MVGNKNFKVITDLEEKSNTVIKVQGTMPHWLSGTLIRNGPVNVTIDNQTNEHWFDGLAMLHAFSFHQSEVHYSHHFLHTDAYYRVFNQKSLDYVGFAIDPCRSLFKRLFTLFIPKKHTIANANINVAQYAQDYVALTEIPLPIRFDPKTLKTLGVFEYRDHLPKRDCWECAHPHSIGQNIYNYLIEYGKTSNYVLYALNQSTRNVIARIPVKQPSYMHSFAITENYLILTEFPFIVRPLDLIASGKAFIKNFTWEPQLGTRFTVVNKNTGEVVGHYKTQPFFAFHHVNAFEQANDLYIDIVCYEDASIIWSVKDYFRNKQELKGFPTTLKRFVLSLKNESIETIPLFKNFLEFPRINNSYDGKPYRFAYFSDPSEPSEKLKAIFKFDTFTQEFVQWVEENCCPGEPVFVAAPHAKQEDEGVVLSLVLNTKTHLSFLLILKAETLEEIGRASLEHAIPPGLHGQYFF